MISAQENVKDEKIKVSLDQMNAILVGVEYGFKQAEAGHNLAKAVMSVCDIFELQAPKK